MANLCSFELHARAKEVNEDTLLEMKRKFGFDESNFNFGTKKVEDGFWVLDSHLDEYALNGKYYIMHIYGECKWAVNGPLLDQLKEFANLYKIDMEIYSEESGEGFQEHYKWQRGELIVDECRDTTEFHVDDIVDDEEDDLDYLFDQKPCQEACCTKDNYQSFADEDGYIRLGGFDWNFEF